MGDRRSRGVTVERVHQDSDAVGHEHLEGRLPGLLRQRMGVAPDEQRSVDADRCAVLADGLRRGEDVRLVEGGLEARPAVAGRPEHDHLVGVRRVGHPVVVGVDERGDVDEVLGLGGPAGARVVHGSSPVVGSGTSQTVERAGTVTFTAYGWLSHDWDSAGMTTPAELGESGRYPAVSRVTRQPPGRGTPMRYGSCVIPLKFVTTAITGASAARSPDP